ncbi:IucA/IucC family C-terminal-domain containing protein [Neobacillus notoginsengisoli]|nr:IucA/IucC family C-terminal-domain containing protein [Neobacillus notoginsengisoli]
MDGMMSVASLLDRQQLEKFLDELKPMLQTDLNKVVASVFMKKYAFIAVPALYSMTAWNKKLDLNPENVFMEPPNGDSKWLPKFYFANAEVEEWIETESRTGPNADTQTGAEEWTRTEQNPARQSANSIGLEGRRKAFLPKERGDDSRDAFREQALSELFADHIFPLVSQLAKITGVSKLILWENVATYIMWLYETVLADERNAAGDFDFFNNAAGALFGNYHRNPMKKFYTEKTYVDDLDEMIRIRQTCCFSYLTGEKAARCKTCPCRKLEMEGKCSNERENPCDAVRSLT